jgi:pyruvate/2-oxoglutarate dehydrogenase complex dihydrolipoamide acyltransferase (E2) component
MKNIQYRQKSKLSPWRKVSLASWRPTGDSSTYCMEDLEMDEVKRYCSMKNINLNSFIIKALSKTLEKHPKINSTVRFWKIRERSDISIFFHTVKDSATDDLSGILINNGHKKSIFDINNEFLEKIELSKNGLSTHDQSKKIVGSLPAILSKPLLNFYSFIAYTLNLNLRIFKAPKNAFGSIMLTAVGSLGISKAICPIAPYTRVPMVISFGKIEKRPTVVKNDLTIRELSTFGFTFDHRIMDGIHFSDFLFYFKTYFTHPNSIENE